MINKDPKEIVEDTRNSYNFIAADWDASRKIPSPLKVSLLKDILLGYRVLDLGCGNGLMVPYIIKKGAFYCGADFAENLIDIARRRYASEIESKQADFVVCDATNLPFEDQEFDFVISFAVLHHIPSGDLRSKFFLEIKRVLKEGGKARIIVWNLLNPWVDSRFDVKSQILAKDSGDAVIPWKATHGKVVNRYIHQFSFEELKNLAKLAGFENVKIYLCSREGELTENGEEVVMEIG